MSDKNADIKNKFIFNSLLYYMDKIIGKVNKAEDKDAYIYITYLAEKIAAAFDKKTFKEESFDFIKYKNLSYVTLYNLRTLILNSLIIEFIGYLDFCD